MKFEEEVTKLIRADIFFPVLDINFYGKLS